MGPVFWLPGCCLYEDKLAWGYLLLEALLLLSKLNSLFSLDMVVRALSLEAFWQHLCSPSYVGLHSLLIKETVVSELRIGPK